MRKASFDRMPFQILTAIVAEQSAEILRLTDRSYALGYLQDRCDPDAIVLAYAAAESVELPNRHGLGSPLADVVTDHYHPLAPDHSGIHKGLEGASIKTVDHVRL
jgi:hypothetical protein